MRKSPPAIAIVLACITTMLWAATPGTFRGIVLLGPDHDPGWIMVQGAKGQMRRVAIDRAQVVFAASIPTRDRPKEPHAAIQHGAEVRVTAEQDSNGDWQASKIEILKLQAEMPIEPSERSANLNSI